MKGARWVGMLLVLAIVGAVSVGTAVEGEAAAAVEGATPLTWSLAVTEFSLDLGRVPPRAILAAWVAAPAIRGDTAAGPEHLVEAFCNVVLDLNRDGKWGGHGRGMEPEWVVKNLPVTVSAGDTAVLTAPRFVFADGSTLPDSVRLRVVVTGQPIEGRDWDGAVQEAALAVTDLRVVLPGGALLGIGLGGGRGEPDAGGAVPVLFPDGAPPRALSCRVTNFGREGGRFTWTLRRCSGSGVSLGPPASGSAWIAAGPPPAPQNPVFLPLTATRVPGTMPCRWSLALGPGREPVPFDGGIVAGVEAPVLEVEFLEPQERPLLFVDGETVEAGFVHTWDPDGGPCVESIATVAITSGGRRPLAWRVDTAALPAWLVVEPTEGTTPATVTLTFDCDGAYGGSGFVSLPVTAEDPETGVAAENVPVITVSWEEGR